MIAARTLNARQEPAKRFKIEDEHEGEVTSLVPSP
jgi:hypothetical protein